MLAAGLLHTMATGHSNGFEEPVKLELPADDWKSVALLSGRGGRDRRANRRLSLPARCVAGAWAAAFAVFASNVATLTLAVAETAPAVELETLPLGLALVMQGPIPKPTVGHKVAASHVSEIS